MISQLQQLKTWSTDIKVVGTALLILWAGTVFALDTRYLTLAGYDAGTIKTIQRAISELEYKLLTAKTQEEKTYIKGLIIIKKQHIREVGK